MLKQKWLIVLPFILAGCYIDSEPPKPWHPAVERSSKHYDVMFKGRANHLSAHQVSHLKRMILSFTKTPPLHARLVLRHSREDLASPLLKSRVHVISEKLVSLGIDRKNIELTFMNNGISHNTKGIDSITVTIDQYQALAPKCGWNEDMHLIVRPEGEKNFGCTNAANLADMIADPYDLLKGRTLANSDGPLNSLAITNLRTDKVKELKVETVSEE